MPEEKIVFPLKPWQKATINAFVVAGITSLSTGTSMLVTGDVANPHLYHSILLSMFISGGTTLLITMRSYLEADLKSDENGHSFTPLMLIGGKHG